MNAVLGKSILGPYYVATSHRCLPQNSARDHEARFECSDEGESAPRLPCAASSRAHYSTSKPSSGSPSVSLVSGCRDCSGTSQARAVSLPSLLARRNIAMGADPQLPHLSLPPRPSVLQAPLGTCASRRTFSIYARAVIHSLCSSQVWPPRCPPRSPPSSSRCPDHAPGLGREEQLRRFRHQPYIATPGLISAIRLRSTALCSLTLAFA